MTPEEKSTLRTYIYELRRRAEVARQKGQTERAEEITKHSVELELFLRNEFRTPRPEQKQG